MGRRVFCPGRRVFVTVVTSACNTCGTHQNLHAAPEEHTFTLVRVNGNSANGYEPWCHDCEAKAVAEMAAL